MSDPAVSVVLVTYNSRDEIGPCLDSLRDQDVPIEVLAVDNASGDGTQGLLKERSRRWPTLKLILNDTNRGLASANNQPLGECRGRYVLILNPDVVVPKEALGKMVQYVDANPTVGVVGPLCLFEDGTPHVSSHRHWTAFHMMFWRMAPFGVARRLYDRLSSYRQRDVQYVTGACLLIRRRLLVEIGGYDERFFLAVEDVADLCLRARRKGHRVVFYPEATITHLGGRSHSGVPFLAQYYGYHGSLCYLKKHSGDLCANLMRMAYFSHSLLKAVLALPLAPFSARFGRTVKDSFRMANVMLRENTWKGIE